MSDLSANNATESDVRPPEFSDNPVCSGDGKTCGECGKIFSHPFYFSTHISIHASEKGFSMAGQCVVCGLTFSDQNIFQQHLVSSQAKLNEQKQAEDDEALVTDNCSVEYDDAEQSSDDENEMDTLNKQLQDIKPDLTSELITVKEEPVDLPDVSDEPKAKRRRQSVQRYEPEVITHTHPDNDPAVEAYLLSLSRMGLTVDPAAFGHPSRRSRGKKIMQGRGRWRGHKQPMERPMLNVSEEILVSKKPSPKYEYLDYDNILEDEVEVLPKSGKQTRGERLQQRLQRLSQQKETQNSGGPDSKTEPESKVQSKDDSKDDTKNDSKVEPKVEPNAESEVESKLEPKVDNKVEIKDECTSKAVSESNISAPLSSPISSDKTVGKVTKPRNRSPRTMHANTAPNRSFALDRVTMKAELEDADYSPHSRKAKGRGGRGLRGHLRGLASPSPRPVFPTTPTQPAQIIPGLGGYARANPNFRPPVVQNVRAPMPVNKINKQGAIASQLRMKTMSATHPSFTQPSSSLMRMPSVKSTHRVTKSASMVPDKGLDRFPKYLKVTSPKGIERAKQESRDYVEIMLQTLTDDLIPNKMNKNFANSKTFFGKPGDFLTATSSNIPNVRAAFPGPRMISSGRGGMLTNPHHHIRGQGRQASKPVFPNPRPVGINSNLNVGSRFPGPSSVRGPRARGSGGAPASAVRGRGGQAFPHGRGSAPTQSHAYPVKMGRGVGTSEKTAHPTPVQKVASKPVSKPVPKPVIISEEVIVLEDDDEEMAHKDKASPSKETPGSANRSTVVVDIDKIGHSDSTLEIIEDITKKIGAIEDASVIQDEKLSLLASVDLKRVDKLNLKSENIPKETNPGGSADSELEVENIDGWKVCLAQNSDSDSDEKSDKEDVTKVRGAKKISKQSWPIKEADDKSDDPPKEKAEGTAEERKASDTDKSDVNESEDSASNSPPSSSNAVPLTFPTFIKDTDNLLDIFSEIEKTCKEIEENSGNEKEDSGNESETKESTPDSKEKFHPKCDNIEDGNSKGKISKKEANIDGAGDKKIVEILKQLDGAEEKPLPELGEPSMELTDTREKENTEKIQENQKLKDSEVNAGVESELGILECGNSEEKVPDGSCGDEKDRHDVKAENSGEVEEMEVELTHVVTDTDKRGEGKNLVPEASVKIDLEPSSTVETDRTAHIPPEGDAGVAHTKYEGDAERDENEEVSKPYNETATKLGSGGLMQADDDDDEAMETGDGDVEPGPSSYAGCVETALSSDQTEFGSSHVPADGDVDMESIDDCEGVSSEKDSHVFLNSQQPSECVSSNEMETKESSLPQGNPDPTSGEIENDLKMTKSEVGGHAEVAKNCESELTSEGLDVIDSTYHVSTSQSDSVSVANPENCSKADRAGVDPELSQSDGQITSENATSNTVEDDFTTGAENDDPCGNSFKKRSQGRNSCKDEELTRGSFDSQDDGDQDGRDSHGGGSNASGSHINGIVGSVSKGKDGTSISNVSGQNQKNNPSDCDSVRSCTFLCKNFNLTKRSICYIKCSDYLWAKHRIRKSQIPLIVNRKRWIRMMVPQLRNERCSSISKLCHCHSTKTLSSSFTKPISLQEIHIQRHPFLKKELFLKLLKKGPSKQYFKPLPRSPSYQRCLKFHIAGSYKQNEVQPTSNFLRHNLKLSKVSLGPQRKLKKYSSKVVCLKTEVHSNLQAHQYIGENPTVHALMRKKKQPPSCTLKHFPSKTVVFNCSGHWLNGSKLPRKSLPCKYRQNKQMPISPDVLNRTSLKGRLKNDKPIWNSLSDGERRKLGIYAYPPTISNFASHPGSHERVRTHGQHKQQNNYRQTRAGRDSNSSRERCNSSSFSSSSGGKSQRNKDNGDNGDENNKDEKSRDFCSVKEDLYLRCRICGVKFECLEESQEHAVKEHSGRIKTQSEFSNPKFYRHFKRSNYKGSQQRFCAERTSSFSEYIETGRFSSNIYEKVTVGPTQIVLVRPTKPVVKNSPDWPHHSLSKTRRAKNLIKCSPPLDLESANIDEVIDVSCSQLLTDETSGILGLEFKQEAKCQISCKVSQLKKKSLTDQKLYTAESEKDDKIFVSQPDAINDQGINSAYAAMTTVGKFEVHCNSGQTGVDGDTVVAGVLAIKTEPLSDSEEESLPVTFDEACLLKRNTLSGGQTSSESCSLLDAGCHSPTQANQTYQISRKVTPSISVNTRSNADVHSVVLNSSANLVQNHLHKVPEIVVVYPDKPVINLLPRKQLNRNRVARRKKDSHQKAEEVHHCPQQCETIQRSPSPRKEDLSLSYPPLKIDPAFSPQEEEISPSHAEVRDQHSPSLKLDTFPLEEENMNALHVKEKIQQSPLPILRIDTTFSLHEENASASHCQADKSLNNPTLVYVYPKRPVINFSGRAPKSASVQVNLAPSL